MPKKQLSFEEAMTELQAVVEKLEAGKVSLADSLALYERGMELVALCSGELDRAEQRVFALKSTPEGLVSEPFTAEAGV